MSLPESPNGDKSWHAQIADNVPTTDPFSIDENDPCPTVVVASPITDAAHATLAPGQTQPNTIAHPDDANSSTAATHPGVDHTILPEADPFTLANQPGGYVAPAAVDHWSDAEEGASESPAPTLSHLHSLDSQAASQVPFLVAMIARLPAMASEAVGLLQEQHLDSLQQSGPALLWRVIQARVREHGPEIIGQAGWLLWLRSATELAIGQQSQPEQKMLHRGIFEASGPSARSLWQRVEDADPTTLMIEQGRELLRKVVHRGLVTDLQHWMHSRHASSADTDAQRLMEAAQALFGLQGGGTDHGYRGQPVDAVTLLANPPQRTQLVQGLLVAGKPAVVGGPLKGQKTGVLGDLAVSLGTGTPFLGRFPVPVAKRVMFVSGESGEDDIANLIQRICQSKNVSLTANQLFLEFDLPQLGSDRDLALLRQAIMRHQAEVIFLDPFYLMLGGGDERARPDANNMFQMGHLLMRAARTCLAAGATPVLCHHVTLSATRSKGDNREPMGLSDLAHAGIAQAARQWLLLSYQSPYDPVTGQCALWLNVGGSSGQGGLYLVNLNQGSADGDLGGRYWNVTIRSGQEAQEHITHAKEQDRRLEQALAESTRREAIRVYLGSRPEGALQLEIAESTGINKNQVAPLLHRLLDEQQVARCHRPGDRSTAKRWRLWPNVPLTEAQNQRLRAGDPVEVVLSTVDSSTTAVT